MAQDAWPELPIKGSAIDMKQLFTIYDLLFTNV